MMFLVILFQSLYVFKVYYKVQHAIEDDKPVIVIEEDEKGKIIEDKAKKDLEGVVDKQKLNEYIEDKKKLQKEADGLREQVKTVLA